MGENFTEEVITLIDEDGVEREFEVLGFIKNDKGSFYALLPTFEIIDNNQDDEEIYFIFKLVNENDEEKLEEVEDDNLLDELSKEFEKQFETSFEVVDSED